jgi:quercetin dioxygenase-like cupin family protein
MPIQSKAAPALIAASAWQTEGRVLRGLLEGKTLNAGISLIRYVTDVIGEGPTLHVHPYDEIFVMNEGNARFTVGDQVIDATTGDVVFGPANIPHGYQNLGPGLPRHPRQSRMDSVQPRPNVGARRDGALIRVQGLRSHERP